MFLVVAFPLGKGQPDSGQMLFLALELSLENRFYSKLEVSGGFSCLWCLSFSSAFLGLYLACIAVEKHAPYQKGLSKLQLLLLLASFLFLLPSLVWQCCFSLFPRQAFPVVLVFNRQLFFIQFQISSFSRISSSCVI